jgi:hypothetical protein
MRAHCNSVTLAKGFDFAPNLIRFAGMTLVCGI